MIQWKRESALLARMVKRGRYGRDEDAGGESD
jgi:hypothetical protein